MKVLSAKVDLPRYRQFKEKATREGLTISQLLRKLIDESFKEKSPPSDKAFVLRESFKILNEAKTICNQLPMPYNKQLELQKFLNMQTKDFETKLKYEERE